MANSFLSLPILVSFILFLFAISGGSLRPANGQASGQGVWCIARPSTSDQALMDNINYACDIVNCSLIQQGGPCFYPTSLMNHASVVMNLYYQKEGRHFLELPIPTSTLQSHCLPRSIRGQVCYIGVSNETSYGVMEFVHAAKNEGLP
ncbi:Carbohydrate-binding X8 domain superfamily protein [Abeliophyllum distichum]|uniref:Carbohydrate-binding X8 domain superfamily protein n=1 Tax=Abeliophyllum distichum TaxID=126358 RepID=A0ABD1QH31_9LAMI